LISVQIANAQDRNRARTLYAEAQQLFNSGNFAAAETSFRAAYNASPNPVVLRAIAAAQERQGNLRGAAVTLQQYLRDNPGASDRAEVEARLREWGGRPGTVTIASVPPGASIILDGRDTGQHTPAQISANAGHHVIELRMNGYQSVQQALDMAASTNVRIDVPLQQGAGTVAATGVTTTTGGGSADPSVEVWITLGLSGAGLIAGTIFGFLALNDQSSYDAMPNGAPALQGIANEGRIFALVCDISFGVALAAGATSILLYILERPSGGAAAQLDPTRVRANLLPWASPQGGGLAATLHF
jgi:tetratricopeptide (TPR) repeat protein